MEISSEQNKNTLSGRIVAVISDIFVPTLPVITAAGTLKALTLLLAYTGLLSDTGSTYYILSFVSGAGFYFLPLLLAHSSAKRFGGNPYLAMFLTAVLLHPDFLEALESGEALTFLSVPVAMQSYGSTVVPAVLIGIAEAYVERFFHRWIPQVISFFAVPLLTTLVMAPLGLLVLGPAGMAVGNGLSDGMNYIYQTVGWPAVALLAALAPMLVTAGFSLCFLPLALASINSIGFDAFSRPAFLAANVAMAASALAVFVRARVKKTKGLALQTSVVAFMGITEPSIYGILLPLRRPYIASILGAFIGGAFAGITHVRAVAYASPSLLTLPIFLNDSFVYTLLTVAIAFVSSFVLTLVLGFKEEAPARAAEEPRQQLLKKSA